MDVPSAPSDDDCYFCPFYRPEVAYEDAAQPGASVCPGPRKGGA